MSTSAKVWVLLETLERVIIEVIGLGTKELHVFLKESDFSIVGLQKNVESKGKLMTLAGN